MAGRSKRLWTFNIGDIMTFEELGKYLDSLIDKTKEDTVKKKPTLVWTQCAPRVFYKCVQLSEQNVNQIVKWLLNTGRFDSVRTTQSGIDTEYGEVLWSDWIIQEPHDAVVFIDKNEFEKQYIFNR